jgi:hypothetical protein
MDVIKILLVSALTALSIDLPTESPLSPFIGASMEETSYDARTPAAGSRKSAGSLETGVQPELA